MDTPTEECLQRMSYSELKKFAKKRGIKKTNKKAKSLIASILETESASSFEDSFVTMEQKIINSCKKNKEEKFDTDKEVDSDTPRRDTYTIESPLDVSLALNTDLITSSASPALKASPADHDKSLNVTMTRGSEKKNKKRKVSFVTPIRRSARLSVLTPHFASVKDRPKTPIPSRVSAGRNRQTPLAMDKKLFTGSLYITNSARKSSEGGKERRPSTPMPNPKPKRMKLSSTGVLETPTATPVSTPVQSAKSTSGLAVIATPVTIPTPTSMKTDSKVKLTPVPNTKSALTPALLSSAKSKRSSPRNSGVKRNVPLNPRGKATPTHKPVHKQLIKTPVSKVKTLRTPLHGNKSVATPSSVRATPKSVKGTTPSQVSSAKIKKTVTPNFNKLHQKHFDKMESIDEYIKRKQVYSSKKTEENKKIFDAVKQSSSKKMALKKSSRIPQKFHGIPFIPSVTSTVNINTNFGASSVKSTKQTPGKRLPAVKFGSHNESTLSKKFADVGAKQLKPVLKENTPLQKKKFDLKASLSKKLRYKPHTGPLKPLEQMNLNPSIFTGLDQPSVSAPVNKVIKAKRVEMRGALKGVRKNKRFELQMQNRKAAMTK